MDWSGRFELRNLKADQALWLEPGSYSFTLESIGNPMKIPLQYRDPIKTPLKYDSVDAKLPITLEITEKWP